VKLTHFFNPKRSRPDRQHRQGLRESARLYENLSVRGSPHENSPARTKPRDDKHIFYADIGDVLLDSTGRLTAKISPDQLHFSALGYVLLASRLGPVLDRLAPRE
jgi:hypothetical protein